MQITIIETEIKTAIRNHILGLISVREDMKIDIDLRATRGQEGFTAIVDILPEDPSGNKTQLTEAAKAASASTTVTKAEAASSGLKAPAIKSNQDTDEDEPAANDTAEATKPQVISFGKKAKAAAAAETEAASETEETLVTPAKSIFAALGRPVNTPATAVNE
jgi:hypothetical protein